MQIGVNLLAIYVLSKILVLLLLLYITITVLLLTSYVLSIKICSVKSKFY